MTPSPTLDAPHASLEALLAWPALTPLGRDIVALALAAHQGKAPAVSAQVLKLAGEFASLVQTVHALHTRPELAPPEGHRRQLFSPTFWMAYRLLPDPCASDPEVQAWWQRLEASSPALASFPSVLAALSLDDHLPAMEPVPRQAQRL